MGELKIYIKSNCENEHENIEEFLLSFGSTQIGRIIFEGHSIKIQNENLNSEYEHSVYYKVFPCSSYFSDSEMLCQKQQNLLGYTECCSAVKNSQKY